MISRKPLENGVAERTGQVRAAQFVCLLALLSLLIGAGAACSKDSKVFVARHGLPAGTDTFAIGDFDGDLAPDIASVQRVSSDSSGANVNYIVQLQFGSGERRSIRLAARWDDLRIVARDVNGDRIPDLIISSRWTEEMYAVLINDGTGAFSPFDPSSVLAPSRKSNESLSWPRRQPSETAATSRTSAERGFKKTKCIGHSSPTKGSVHRPDSVSLRCPLLVSLPGHAPPRLTLL